MLVLAAFHTNEISVIGTSDEWTQFGNWLEAANSEYPLRVANEVAPWDDYLRTLRVERRPEGPVLIQIFPRGVLKIQGSSEALHILAENAREMVVVNTDEHEHVHVDAAILPEVISEKSAVMTWKRCLEKTQVGGVARLDS